MSKLNIDQQTIFQLFSDKRSDFLIPDYQRPYAWDEAECETLWDDIFSFAFPQDDYSQFNSNDEYFLGPIVTFRNNDKKLEIIDGQQRLTTLMLLLRAFYSKFGSMKDPNSISTAENIAKCIWKTDEFGRPNKEQLKIDSDVSSDNDKDEFLTILKTGQVQPIQVSRYARVFRFFQTKIDDFLSQYPSYFAYLPTRIMQNCILLPIEAESQDTALRIFSTLNDRGKPLADTDIFKAQFYKFYSDQNQKDQFIDRWKKLEALCGQIFPTQYGSPMDELFTRYMYYERAKQGIKNSTTEALRKFYEKNNYTLLRNYETLGKLEDLARFWENVVTQNDSIFSERVLKQLGVLRFAPNGMWTYLLSVYYLQNKNTNDLLDDKKLYLFLNTITLFIWAYAIMRPGVNALRIPAYPEMINIVNNAPVCFSNFKFDKGSLLTSLHNFEFTNNRLITKSMLAWWMYHNPKQDIIPAETNLEIEHIYSRKQQESDGNISQSDLESLGNKALLEKTINIRAADYKFVDKIKYYKGYTTASGKVKTGTMDAELLDIAKTHTDFAKQDIKNREKLIINSFISALEKAGLIL